MKKMLLLGLSMCLLAASLTGCGNKPAPTTSKAKLVVAMELAYPPFEMKDAAGNPTGVSVDFAQALGKELGREVVIQNTAWEGLIPSVQTGKADLVISSMSVNAERQKSVDFSVPYANSMLGILASKNAQIKTIEDLNQPGKKIAVKIGTVGFLYAKKHIDKAEIIALADESACAAEVQQGKADGFLYDQLTVYRHWQKNPTTTTAIFVPYQDVDKWCVAVKKGNTELLNQVNAFIPKYTASGGFEQLSQKYLPSEKAAFDKLGFRWFFDVK
ncbi:MAG: transporter substrate-binding domain-containing protein [Acidaminococcaceae bacterium]